MKTFWPLLLFVILHQSIYAQEVKHAPTVDQCRADQKLWFSYLEDTSSGNQAAHVRYDELTGWLQEMMDCDKVDPEFDVKYYNNAGEISAEKLNRVAHFLQRHKLWGQFLAEDAQGKR